MPNSPKVSILIPVYSRANLILETLNSAVNQTYENIEVIVVDNKSTDNTFEILKKFADSHPNVRVYQNEENIGPVRNWRRCLDYATGEYVKILWSDDLIAPTFIEKTLPYLVDNEDVGFVYTKTYITEGNRNYSYINDIVGKKERGYFISESIKYPSGKTPVSPGCALFRKVDVVIENSIPNGLALNHENTGAGIDLLIYLNPLKRYRYCYYTSDTTAYFKKHNESISIMKGSAIWKYYLTALSYCIKENMPDYIYNLKISTLQCFTLEDLLCYKKLLSLYGFDDCIITKRDLMFLMTKRLFKSTKKSLRNIMVKTILQSTGIKHGR